MKLLIPLAVVGVAAASFGLYMLKASTPAPLANTPVAQTTPTPTPAITPIQTKESLDAILQSADATTSAEQAAAASAEISGSDQSLSAEDQVLKSLNTTAGTYAN
ncbi:MAG: hypothetical protein KBD66_00995 [Candidatus Doudnabacteria bacterium]|nr:hypothetical protein [Candidatus Doudnabacteria bacterium]